MNNKLVLNQAKRLHVLVDSNTFENLLCKSDRLAIAILKYYNSSHLEFVRSHFETIHDELKNIVEYELMMGNNSEIESVSVKGAHSIEIAFNYKNDDILAFAQHIYDKKMVSEKELATIRTTFIHAVFSFGDKASIYVTNDDTLLKNRLWIKSRFLDTSINIMSLSEASIFLDIFFKKNDMYCTSGGSYLNKGYWYWLSMRLKIPHYNVGDPIIDALAHRLCYALTALDEITIQFYSGVNNDTMDNTLYHFNYLLSLIAGIFDNLALKTNESLGINFKEKMRISLSNKDFLKKFKDYEKGKVLRSHIIDYSNYIKLIYDLRHLVIHNEGFSNTRFHNADEIGWDANFITIPKEYRFQINPYKKTASKYNSISNWGVYEMNGIDELFLEPHYFSVQAITELVKFVDKYLALLGCSSFVDEQKANDTKFAKAMETFEKYHLGI